MAISRFPDDRQALDVELQATRFESNFPKTASVLTEVTQGLAETGNAVYADGPKGLIQYMLGATGQFGDVTNWNNVGRFYRSMDAERNPVSRLGIAAGYIVFGLADLVTLHTLHTAAEGIGTADNAPYLSPRPTDVRGWTRDITSIAMLRALPEGVKASKTMARGAAALLQPNPLHLAARAFEKAYLASREVRQLRQSPQFGGVALPEAMRHLLADAGEAGVIDSFRKNFHLAEWPEWFKVFAAGEPHNFAILFKQAIHINDGIGQRVVALTLSGDLHPAVVAELQRQGVRIAFSNSELEQLQQASRKAVGLTEPADAQLAPQSPFLAQLGMARISGDVAALREFVRPGSLSPKEFHALVRFALINPSAIDLVRAAIGHVRYAAVTYYLKQWTEKHWVSYDHLYYNKNWDYELWHRARNGNYDHWCYHDRSKWAEVKNDPTQYKPTATQATFLRILGAERHRRNQLPAWFQELDRSLFGGQDSATALRAVNVMSWPKDFLRDPHQSPALVYYIGRGWYKADEAHISQYRAAWAEMLNAVMR